jgi:hypothetical protein
MALSTIATEQTIATKRTLEQCAQLLDYLARNSDAKVQFHASDMVINIHSNTSCLTSLKQKHAAKLMVTSSWVGNLKMANPFVSTGRYTLVQISSVLLWPPLPRLNLELCTTIAKLA